MRSARRFAASIVIAAPLAAATAAIVPTDGTPIVLSGTSAAAQPHLAGTVVEELLSPYRYTMDWNGSGASFIDYTMTGTVQSRVVKAIDGTFDFYWRILPDPRTPFRGTDAEGSPISGIATYGLPITALAISSFGAGAGALRADWRSDGLGGAAPQVAAAAPGAISFGFGGTFIMPGGGATQLDSTSLTTDQSSRFVFVDTDAHAYAKTASFAVSSLEDSWFGGFGAPVPTFAPAPVPEPATWLLMLLGLGTAAAAARRNAR